MKASLPKHHILYKTTNIINNKIYIGVHSTYNLDDGYLGSGKDISNAILKYGKENFKREIIQEFETREAALTEEANIVNGIFIRSNSNYNKNLGGGHNWYGMVSVRDKDGNTFQVAKDDPRYLSGEVVHINTGNVSVIDKAGNRFKVPQSDERLKTDELHGVTIGRTIYQDKTGKGICTSKYDQRVKSGELKHVLSQKVTVKDSDGNTMQVSVDDPRLKTGELVGIMKGHKHKIVTCPYCGKEGSLAGLGSTHFKYCNKNPNRIHRKEWKTKTCPYCGKEGKGSPMTRFHFDNCKSRTS